MRLSLLSCLDPASTFVKQQCILMTILCMLDYMRVHILSLSEATANLTPAGHPHECPLQSIVQSYNAASLAEVLIIMT